MILEQLVTAGTITEFEIWKLRRWYKKVCGKRNKQVDLERGENKVGGLKIGYYHPREGRLGEEEPVKSHLKMVIVDEEVTVLGSGNMDRARYVLELHWCFWIFSNYFSVCLGFELY